MRPALFYLLLLVFSIKIQATTITTSCSINGDTSVCLNEITSYSSGYSGAFTFQWSASGGTIIGSNANPSVNVSWPNTGPAQLAVIIKDSLSNVVCTKLVNVMINAAPTPEIISEGEAACRRKDGAGGNPDGSGVECIQVCDSTWVQYSTTLNAGSNYTWVITGAATYTTSSNTANVFWSGPGTGSVKVIETNSDSCSGEDEICIEIIENPNASFYTTPAATFGSITVCLGQDVYFFNTSNDGGGSPLESFEWIFGDGENEYHYPPENGNTSHAYTTSGTYTVYLVIINECGCRDTAELDVNVLSDPGPDISCISTVCPGSVMTYTTSASCPSYTWSTNGNGTIIGTDTASSVTVQWSGTAPAILTLDVDTCSSYCPTPTSIVVPVIPNSATIFGDSVVCQYTCNEYAISCDIPVDSIIWHIPSGITVIGDTINVHSLTLCVGSAGYSGTIWVEYFHNTNGSTTDLSCGGNAYLPINVRPNLSIIGTADYCENDAFNFSIPGGTGNIGWSITDGTGTTTYLSSILPTTSSLSGSWVWGPGTFILTATDLNNEYCDASVTKVITVNEAPSSPIISGEDTICPNSTYNYSAAISSAEHAISWNVINGTPSSSVASSINITWGSSGPYMAIATEIDPVTLCKSIADTMNVYSALPIVPANIYGPDTICSSGEGNFYTTSSADQYIWSVNPSSQASVVSGQFSNAVAVQANNTTGYAWIVLKREVCSSSRSDSIQVYISPPPTPSIFASSTACAGQDISFSASSAASYNWNFGDGFTSSSPTPIHDYDSAGTYVVTLIVNYGGSCPGSASTTHTIVVDPSPSVSISTSDPTLYCNLADIDVTMTIASSGATTCTWYQSGTSVSTSASYNTTAPGSFYVVCTNSYGCSDTSNVITVDTISCDTCNPANYSLAFGLNRLGCNTDSFNYFSSNVGSHSWNFGDIYNPGTNFATGNNVLHTYTEPGAYLITLCGNVPNVDPTLDSCEVCVSRPDTIYYVPDFYPNITCVNYSDSFSISFINNTKVYSLAPSPSYAWSINGSGTLSTATNYITNLSPGTYNVTLTIAGVCSITKTVIIDSVASANYTVNDSICEDAPIIYTNTSTGSFSSIFWDFGDGTSSLNANPVKVYENPGIYYSSLTITTEFGCLDSMVVPVVVMPNTLNVSIGLSGANEFCFGDSVILTANASGGYPGYTYLWNTTASSPSFTAYFTNNYSVEIWDSKQCYASSPDTSVIVQPYPNAVIKGPDKACQFESIQYSIPVPNTGHTINWYVNGTLYSTSNQLNYYASSIGMQTIVVSASNTFGCAKNDTLNVMVHPRPNVSIATMGSLCAGDSNLLIANSTSSNLVSMQWNTGSTNDSIYVKAAGIYEVTVIDSNGCEASSAKVINKLPDFCGLMTGCYEICDTVTQLVWHAPKGYSSYQWYYNGNPIVGSVADTLHLPLYQSGTYNVWIMNSDSCSAYSDPIDISFVHCGGCTIDTRISIVCDQVDIQGNQSYSLSFTINNPLGPGANISLSTGAGIITGLSPGTLNAGSNTITATFTDIGPKDSIVCFTIAIWDQEQRCDTIICDTLPSCNCDEPLSVFVSQEPFDCIGYDGSGNPQYYGCVNLNWSGSSSTSLTLVTASGAFSPNPVAVVNGSQVLCFTYTDFLPLDPVSVMITAYFYDSTTMQTCVDSFEIHYKECPRECRLEITSLCAHCEEQNSNGEWSYLLELDIYNPFPNNANVSIIPISAGTFGAISPNPIAPGTTTVSTVFTDISPSDSLICFRVILTEVGSSALCYKDICISLPDCRHVGIIDLKEIQGLGMTIYPNPASKIVNIELDQELTTEGYHMVLIDPFGKELNTQLLQSNHVQMDVSELAAGMYYIQIMNNSELILYHKIIIE